MPKPDRTQTTMFKSKSLTKEQRFVVEPLKRWFTKQKANWNLESEPRHGKSTTGWDLEYGRKNQDLLIEAKYIQGSFVSSFAGLVCAPLSHRLQKSMKRKYRSWSYGICWAIGADDMKYTTERLYQNVLDYLARNMKFWRCYGRTLKMKYVYFVQGEIVLCLKWKQLLGIADIYADFFKDFFKSKDVKDENKRTERMKRAKTLFSQFF